MNNKINTTIEKYNMLSSGDRVLVAVSGGADSMLLLHYMLSMRNKYNITVCAAHVEHGIRGQSSVDDAEFVKSYCNANAVAYYQLSIDAVNESKKRKMGVEEYSREKRYAFFDTIDCDKIATAHNLSDNIETLLFRLSRKTGLKGACAIPPVRGKIIRPLIELSSEEIRQYCAENHIEYRVDSTNFSNDYARNYIRNHIIPDFKKLNCDFEKNTADFISDINEDMTFIEEYADEAYSNTFFNDKLKISVLSKYSISIIKRVILNYFSVYNIRLDRVHLNSVIALLDKAGRIQICGDYYAVSDSEYLRCADFSKRNNIFPFVSKVLKFSEFDFKSVDFYCDYDKIIGTVKIRGRMPGDKISPAGRGCTKTLKKLFNELKIPQELRESIGIVTDEQGVIGVIGYCVAQRVSLSASTQNIYCLSGLPSED